MKSLKDLLQKKADDIEVSGIKTDLHVVQAELDRYFSGDIKVTKIKNKIATVETSNASLASNMRMQQTQLVEDLNSSLKNKLDRFIIRIQ